MQFTYYVRVDSVDHYLGAIESEDGDCQAAYDAPACKF